MSSLIDQSLKLDKFIDSDFDLYFQLVSKIEVMQMITERALSKDEALAEFSQILKKNNHHPALGSYKILDVQTEYFIGFAKLELEQPDANTAELGYMLLPEYWGKGIGSQVAKILIDHAKKQHQLNDLIAIIDPKNVASKKILINQGFYSKAFKDFDGLAGEILELTLKNK